MKIDTIQTSFAGGEFSASLFGRTDIAQYSNACATVENFLVRPYGSLISAPGTEFINDTKNSGPNQSTGIDSDTILLLHFDNNLTDSSGGGIDSPHTLTSIGPVTFDSSNYKFGNYSGLFTRTGGIFPTSGGYITISDSNDWHLPSYTSWTLDLWVRFTNIIHDSTWTDSQVFVSQAEDPSDRVTEFGMFSYPTTGGNANKTSLFYTTAKTGVGSYDLEAFISPTLATNTWYHVAYVKSNSTLSIYLDGVLKTSSTITVSMPNFSAPLYIGRRLNSGNYLDGNLEEIRLSKTARWTDNFTPPTQAYSNASNYKARLIPFVFSRDDAYIIEAGVGYFRFYTDGAVVNA